MKNEKEKCYLDRIAELEKELKRYQHKIKKDTYGLHWLDVPEAFEDDVQNKLPILKELKEKAIVNRDDKPIHILIEGDNYHALTCLNYTHKGKIDLIYIDPPYNTGSDGFKYMDKRILGRFPDGTEVPKDHPLRHSYWLSFMGNRLRLAKKLLKDSGVIFISINEEELSQLKLLCDEVFNRSNYLAMFTVKVRHEDRILKGDKDFHEVVEYLLLYRKSFAHKTAKREKENISFDEYIYDIKELNEKPERKQFGIKIVDVFKPEEYEIIRNEPNKERLKKINIRGAIKEGNSSGRFYMSYLDGLKDKRGYLFKVYDMGADGLGYRYLLIPESPKRVNGDYFQGIPIDSEDIKMVPYPNYLDYEEDFNNVGYEGGIDFRNGKKPISFILKIFEMGGIFKNKDSIVLDFFAGSGSTAHALLELNEYDGGMRQCILSTNNEVDKKTDEKLRKKGIKPGDPDYEICGVCKGICYPRLNNAINGFMDSRGRVFNPLGGSLKYYKTDFVGQHNIIGSTDEDKIELAHHAGELLAIAENTLYQLGDLQNDYYQFFHNNKQYTGVYFREELVHFEEFREKVLSLDKPVTVYIFSWAENEFANQFDDRDDIEVKPIPKPILEVYKAIYNLS